jgi:hypothetical protein
MQEHFFFAIANIIYIPIGCKCAIEDLMKEDLGFIYIQNE